MTAESQSLRTAGKQQRGRPFRRGKSGNAAGRPKGARNRATILSEALSATDALAIARAVTRKAKKGDMLAARLVLDRLWPAPKGRLVEFEKIPEMADATAVLTAHTNLVKSVAGGAITPEEAQNISGLLAQHLKMIEVAMIKSRLNALESRMKNQ